MKVFLGGLESDVNGVALLYRWNHAKLQLWASRGWVCLSKLFFPFAKPPYFRVMIFFSNCNSFSPFRNRKLQTKGIEDVGLFLTPTGETWEFRCLY